MPPDMLSRQLSSFRHVAITGAIIVLLDVPE